MEISIARKSSNLLSKLDKAISERDRLEQLIVMLQGDRNSSRYWYNEGREFWYDADNSEKLYRYKLKLVNEIIEDIELQISKM